MQLPWEWEHACRAGTTTTYSTGESLTTTMAAIDTSPVRRIMAFKPNPYGLYDMHGLKIEYCSTMFDPSSEEAINTVNPRYLTVNKYRVARGGSLDADALASRSAKRSPVQPDWHQFYNGFRVAVSLGSVRNALKTSQTNARK